MIISHTLVDDIMRDIDKHDMNMEFKSSYKNYMKKNNINNLSPDDIKLIESDYNKMILMSKYVRSNNVKGLKEMNLTFKDIENLRYYDLLSDAIDNNSNEEFIEYCMELYGHNFNYSKILANPLFLALKNNNLHIAQKLIDGGADINYSNYYQDALSYLLMTDSLNKENLQFLIENKVQLNIELFEIIKNMPNTSELISSIKNFFKPNGIKNDIKIYPFDFLIFQERNNEKINCEKEILLKYILKCETFDINTINYKSIEYIVKKKLNNLLELLIHNKEEFIESELCIHALKYASSICDDVDILTYLIDNIDNECIFDKYGIMLAFEIVKKQNIENEIINLMSQLIDKGININEKYNNSFLLIESIKTKNNNLTKMLIDHGAKVHVKDEEKKNALMLSIINENNDDVMELLLQKNIDIDDKDSNKNTVLHYACKYNAINIVKTLLKEKYKLKINEKNTNGQTPLMISIIENNWSCALQLLECNNIDPNITNKEDITPLIYMTTNSIHQSEIYYKLFKHKAYFNIKDINKKSFLNKIIENDELIRGFKDTGIFIDNGNRNIKKFNSLIFAIKINNMNLLKKLLIYGLNPNEKDDNNETPLLVALKQNNLEAIKILIENKVDYITDKQQIVHLASKCDKEILKYIFELENINESDAFYYDKNCKYIFNACSNDDINSLEKIIKNNDVSYIINEKNKDGLTPFSYSIKEKKYRCAEYLLDYCNDIDVNAVDLNGHTALDYFIIYKVQDKYSLLEKLISRGGFIDNKYFNKKLLDDIIHNNDLIKYFINKGIPIRDNKSERTYKIPNPLIFSVKQNSYPFVKALLENKIPIDEIDSDHKSAMIYAIDNENKSIIELLLEYKFDINKTYDDEKDITPIIYTVEKNKPSLFNYLISTVSELDEDQIISSIIAYSLNHKNFDMIEFIVNNSKYKIDSISRIINKLLAESKIDLTSKNENGYTLSHYACFKGKKFIIKELFKNNQDFNIKNEEEMTPLMIAVINKKYDCAKYLLKEDHSLDVNCKDIFGETAMSYLLKNLDYDDEIIELFYEKGCYFNKNDFKDESRLKYIMKCISLLKLFIERGIRLKTKKDETTIIKTPVIFSVKNNIKNLLISLLNLKANANEKDNDNKSPLYYAIFNNNIDLIQTLLNFNANINDEIMSGKTALIYVIENNKKNIFNNLIQNKNVKDNLDIIIQYIYDYSLRLKNFDIITFLVERFKDKEYNIYTPLKNLVNLNKYDIHEISNDDGWNLLHYASHTGNMKLLTLLLDESLHLDLDINKKCNDGSTPLMLSIKNGKIECAAHLIDNSADVNICDGNGDTPLVYMLNHNSSFNDYIFDKIIEKDAFFPIKYIYDIDYLKYIINNKSVMKKITYQGLKIKDEKGEILKVTNPLIYAAKNNNNIFAEELIRNGSTINDTDKFNNNALIYALINKNTNLVKILLSHNIDWNYSNINNKSPIIIAINRDDSESFKLIINSINNNIERNEKMNKIIKNIIQYAEETKNYNIIKFIHKHLDRETYFNYEKLNDFINEKDKNYNVKENKVKQPLHFACMYDNNNEIKNLTNKYINEQNNDGSTPLMVAIKNNCYKNVELLIDLYPKIDVNIADYHGMTPLTYLINNNKDYIDYSIILLKKGASLTLDYIKNDNNFENLLKSNVVVQYIMKNGIRIKEHNNEEHIIKNLTKFAIDIKQNKLLEAMIKNNLDIEKEQCNGKNAILYAIDNNNKDAFNMLIKQIPENEKQSILQKVIKNAFTSMDCSILSVLKNWTNSEDVINIINDANNNIEMYRKEGYKPLHVACKKNNIKLINSLIKVDYDVNTTDDVTKETALITAIKGKKYEAVNILLNDTNINVNIYDSEQNTPLMYMINDADENNKIFEEIIQKCGKNEINYFDLLLHALKMNRINYSKIIIEKSSIDINNSDNNGKTIMSYLIDNKIYNKEGFDLLFEKGAYIEPNYINDNESIKLIENNIGLIKSIAQNGFYTKRKNNVIQVKTPVIFFIKSSKNKMIEKLLENKASVEEKDENGNTPIFHSIRSNNKNAFITLLKYDADTTKRNNMGQTPLICAEKKRKNSYFVSELKKPRLRRSSNTDSSQKLNSIINQKNDDYIESTYIKRRKNSKDSNDNMDNLYTISDIINNNKLNKNSETKNIKYVDMASVSIGNVEPKIDYIKIDSKDNSVEKVNDSSNIWKTRSSKKKMKNIKDIKENQLITEKPQTNNYLLNNNKLDVFNYLNTGIIESSNTKKSKKLKKSLILIDEESDSEYEEKLNKENKEESNSDNEEYNNEYEEEFNDEYDEESNSEYEDESNSEYEDESNSEYEDESNSEYEDESNSEFNEVSNNEYEEEETFVSAIDSNDNESIENIYNNEESIESINYKNEFNIGSNKKIFNKISDNNINNTNQLIDDKNSSNIDETNINQTIDNDTSTSINDETSTNQVINDNDMIIYPELHYACLKENEVFIQMFIDFSYNINEQCDDGSTPLLLSIKNEKLRSVEILIKNKADVNIPDNEGVTPLLYAVKNFNKNEELIEKLLSNGANPNCPDKNNEMKTPLIYAIEYKNNNLVRLLLENNANVEYETKKGITPIKIAVRTDNLAIAEMLLNKKQENKQLKKNFNI